MSAKLRDGALTSSCCCACDVGFVCVVFDSTHVALTCGARHFAGLCFSNNNNDDNKKNQNHTTDLLGALESCVESVRDNTCYAMSFNSWKSYARARNSIQLNHRKS